MKLAILLDLDNLKPRLETLEALCSEHGTVVERRAFANTPAVLAAYGSSFREYGYRFELAPGVNALPQEVDGLIYRTARELAERRGPSKLDGIVIVSNDGDFAPLCHELRRQGLRSLAIGGQMSRLLREAADVALDFTDVLRPVHLGIDLGTTNTVMALANTSLTKRWNASVLEVMVMNESSALTSSSFVPSAVRFELPAPRIGGFVRQQAYATRNRTVLAWKHNMGVSEHGRPYYYQLEQPQAPSTSVPPHLVRFASSGQVAPEEAAACVLDFCRKRLIEKHPQLQGIVITHPASYESDAIEATRRAAVLAGWREDNVVLLPEPHAALFDFLERLTQGELGDVLDVSVPRHLMVYDLGGGTLDVSLHEVRWDDEAQRFRIDDLAIGSRTRIGGDLIDEMLADGILRVAPVPPTLTPAEREKLRHEIQAAAEPFKKLWGARYAESDDPATFSLTFQLAGLGGKAPIRVKVGRQGLLNMLEPLLCSDLGLDLVEASDPAVAFDLPPFTDRFNTLVVPVLELLLKVKQSRGLVPKVDAVLLNGGMTYFPLVRERLASLFGSDVPLLTHGNPDVAVARGAALFAAGVQGTGARRVNPTHIYLEVHDEKHEVRLERLVAQGQTYPYRTSLRNLRLPMAYDGVIPFRIWVGMGTRPGINTVLQRQRQVPVEIVHEAHLTAGCLLDLEVEYSFDERLMLTLKKADDPNVQLKIEVAPDNHGTPGAVAPHLLDGAASPRRPGHGIGVYATALNKGDDTLVPPLIRERSVLPAGHETVDYESWERLARDLGYNESDRLLQHRLRALVQASSTAANRLDLCARLMDWFKTGIPLVGHAPIRLRMAFRGVRAILQVVDPRVPEVQAVEQRFEQIVRQAYQSLRERAGGALDATMVQELAETPGKLLLPSYDGLLQGVFESLRYQTYAHAFLNSLGKCGHYAVNADWLVGVLNHPHSQLSQREKAAWALARLLSPGQPEAYRTTAVQAYRHLPMVLERLERGESDARALTSLVVCLYQIVAWVPTSGTPLPASLGRQVEQARSLKLAAAGSLKQYPGVAQAVGEKLRLLPTLLSWSTAQKAEREMVREFLLEVVKG